MAERLSLIHAGVHTPQKETNLRAAMERVGLPEEVEIYWMPGAPDTAILRAVEAHGLDLLMAGALEKERPIRYYLGSVARNLVREASCSLMLLTEPQVEPGPWQRMVVVVDYSEQSLLALTKAVHLAGRMKVEQVFVIRVLSETGTAMAFSEWMRREQARTYQTTMLEREGALLKDLVDASGSSRVPIETHIIEGHTGYVAAQFARQRQADLLVMPSANRPGHFFERLFPSDMEWVLREIPCNLWVVRENLP